MPHADYLSRNPPVVVANQVSRQRNWAQIAQSADDETQKLLQQLRDGELDSTRYVSQNDLLYYKYSPVGEDARLLCYIPKGHKLSLLRIFHDEHEHINADKTLDLILKHFWFPGLRQFVNKYVAHCLVCISKKRVPRSPNQNITSWGKPDSPFHTVHMDVLGPLPISNGYKFILVVVDASTKFCLLYSIYMHHANGQVERYIRTILNMLRIEVNHKASSWSEALWKLQLVLNMTKQKTTQASPLNLMIGTDATTPLIRNLIRDVTIEGTNRNRDAWREMCRSRANELMATNKQRQDDYANRLRRPPRQFKLDDLVFVIKYSQSTGKLDPGMRGPYRVVKVLPNGRYELKLLSGSYGKTTQAAAQYMVAWRVVPRVMCSFL